MFYLIIHSTHFVYCYLLSRHMVKYCTDNKRGNPLPFHVVFFLIGSKVSFIWTISDMIELTTIFVSPVVEHMLNQETNEWSRQEGLIQ